LLFSFSSLSFGAQGASRYTSAFSILFIRQTEKSRVGFSSRHCQSPSVRCGGN